MSSPSPLGKWRLFTPGRILKTIDHLEPRLASWNKKSDPDQVRLQAYLDDLKRNLGPLPEVPQKGRVGLALHLDVDVGEPEKLLHHHDLENYLTPIVGRLGAAPFSFVSARKQVGGGSTLTVSQLDDREPPAEGDGWRHLTRPTGSGPETKRWKGGIRDALAATCPKPLPDGPVEVHQAWRCSPSRNWSNLWKTTGDAMGPVLGEPYPDRPFYPNDDRITFLGLHLNLDDAMVLNVDVGLWWRPA